jgi:hypothetical protein
MDDGAPGTTRAFQEGRMSYRELSMIEVKEVLRRHEARVRGTLLIMLS